MLFARGLGPLSLQVDGREVVLGGRLARRFTAALVVRGGASTSDDLLVEAVWGVDAPPQSAASLQAYVSRLRAELGDHRHRVERTGDGYRLQLDDCDVWQFERIVASARDALSRDAFAALSDAQEAVSLWRGEPFPELDDAEIVAVDRARLVEIQEVAVETMIEARLYTGDAAGSVADAQRATQDAPFREHRWGLLIRALYRSGRHSEAMSTLAQVKRLLADELGIDAGPELQELERQVFSGDADLMQGVESAPLLVPVSSMHSNRRLPALRSSFHGRGEELHDIATCLAGASVVTLVGPGGVGKTRLALQWASAAVGAGEVWFVPLADARRGEEVATAVARGIGLAAVSNHPIDDMVAALEGRKGVLVVDNCEHLTQTIAALVVELTDRLDAVCVLATSREPLGIDAEIVLPINPLPVSAKGSDGPAFDLLLDRIQTVRRGWQPTSTDMEELRRLCTTIDGLPLALELAAARARTMSVSTIIEHLDGSFASLGDVPTGSPTTHANLSDAIGWSVDALNPADLDLIRRLSSFEGGFDLELAIAAEPSRGEPHVLNSLASLVSKSIIFADISGAITRYRVWETIRLYVTEHDPSAIEHKEQCAIAIRALVGQAASTMGSPRSRYAMEQLERELANVRFLLRQQAGQDPVAGLHTLASIEWFWFRAGLIEEGIRLSSLFLRLTPDGDRVDRARVNGIIAVLSGIAGNMAAAVDAFNEADALLSTVADGRSWYAGHISYLSAVMMTAANRLDQAEQAAMRAIDIGQSTDVALVQANGMMQLGVIRCRQNRLVEGEELLRGAAAITTNRGSPWTAGMAALHLARELSTASPESASIQPALTLAISTFRDERDLNSLAISLQLAADLAERTGRMQLGDELHRSVVQAARDLQLPVDGLNKAPATGSPGLRDGVVSAGGRALLLEAVDRWLSAVSP